MQTNEMSRGNTALILAADKEEIIDLLLAVVTSKCLVLEINVGLTALAQSECGEQTDAQGASPSSKRCTDVSEPE